MLNKLISGWAYNRDKNAFCSNFGQKRGVGVHSGVGLLSSEYGIAIIATCIIAIISYY